MTRRATKQTSFGSTLSDTKTKSVVSRRTTCRLCGGRELDLVLELAPTPPANAFVTADLLAEKQDAYPLDLFLCSACGHLQLLEVVDPEVLFRDYVYVSSTSPVFVDHFRGYADEVIDRYTASKVGLVVEIGSNDGTFLELFKEHGFQVLGVDPARNIARTATESGIETWPTFFTPELALKIRQERGCAAVIAANNVFAHADDLDGVAQGIRDLLAPDGVFVFEVSYLVDVVENTLFDTIYHEHLSYHTVGPLEDFFRRHALELFEVQRVPTHGGSLRGLVQIAGDPRPVSADVEGLVSHEREMGLHCQQAFRSFALQIDRMKAELSSLVRGLKAQGKTIAGFGAPAKATTLLYHLGLGDVLDFIVDDSPLKQGLFTPGHHIPVLDPEAIYDQRPDYVLILAWNFARPIMNKHREFQEQGGHFIVPLPEVEVI